MTLHIAVIGSGPSGMTAAMLLARQGHRVTLVDRDPGPVADRPWERVGVMQFHHPHSLRAPGRMLLAQRLPDVHDALVAAGAEVRTPPGMPEAMAAMHVRRSVLEQTIWECTSREPGRAPADRPRRRDRRGRADRARGVVVDGTFVPADLVVDASGGPGASAASTGRALEGAAGGRGLRDPSVPAAPGRYPRPDQRRPRADQGARGLHAARLHPRPRHVQPAAGARGRRRRARRAAPRAHLRGSGRRAAGVVGLDRSRTGEADRPGACRLGAGELLPGTARPRSGSSPSATRSAPPTPPARAASASA